MRTLFTLLPLLFAALPAEAYIGPGLGAGAIGAVIGVILSVFIALFAIFWYPVKRMIRNRREKQAAAKDDKAPAE